MVKRAKAFLNGSHDPYNDWKRIIIIALTCLNVFLAQRNSEKISRVESTQTKVEAVLKQKEGPTVETPTEKRGE